MKKLLLLLIPCLLAGCANLKPEFYAAATRAALNVARINSPETVGHLQLAADLLCQATMEASLQPVTFQRAVNADNISPTALAVIDGIQLLYIAAISQLSDTNRATLLPYARAVWCQGFDVVKVNNVAIPLRSRSLPPVPLKFVEDPRFPLTVRRP